MLRQLRRNLGSHQTFYEPLLIKRVLHQYSLKKNQAKTMQLKQFPIVLAHAVTAHKMQGQTSQKPLRVSMNVAECFDEAQGYVRLSRVQSLDQVVIRESQKLKKDREIRKLSLIHI